MICQRCGAERGLLADGPACDTCKSYVSNALSLWRRQFEAYVGDRFLSLEEEATLRAYQLQLRLTDADMAPVMPMLMRAKTIAAILAGHLPNVIVPGVVLPMGEVAHYVTGAALVMTTYATEYVRATRGSTVRIAKGVSFRTSGTRGHHVTIPTNHTLPGLLVVTNANVTFYGRQIISLPLREIAGYNYSGNTIEFTYRDRTDESFFQVHDAEIVAATFFAARTKADEWFAAPPSVRGARVGEFIDPAVLQQREAAERLQQEAAAAQQRAAEAERQAREEAAAAQRRAVEAERQAVESARREAEAARKRERFERLANRFGEENARRIIAQDIWVGATNEMILESFGKPAEVTEKVLKTKTKRVLKYRPLGGNRFGLRITLDNDEVVGWDK